MRLVLCVGAIFVVNSRDLDATGWLATRRAPRKGPALRGAPKACQDRDRQERLARRRPLRISRSHRAPARGLASGKTDTQASSTSRAVCQAGPGQARAPHSASRIAVWSNGPEAGGYRPTEVEAIATHRIAGLMQKKGRGVAPAFFKGDAELRFGRACRLWDCDLGCSLPASPLQPRRQPRHPQLRRGRMLRRSPRP